MITPILHRVLLKLDPVEEVTSSGIVLPKEVTSKERKAIEIGTVVAIGDTAFKAFDGNEDTIKVGQRVVIARYSGKEIVDADEQEYVVVNDEDILVILGE